MTTVDVTIPVYNEEKDLPRNIPILHAFLSSPLFPYSWRIIIADNASTDATPEVGKELARSFSHVEYMRIEEKGRGIALRTVWSNSQADVVSYMDVDLSTELSAFPALVRAVVEEGYDVAIGTRLAKGAQVRRSWRRTFLSRGYMVLLKVALHVRFSDAQCGFKALRREVAQTLLPLTLDRGWFFDTELLVLAERAGYRIAQIPVRWEEDPDTRVRLLPTIVRDLQGVWRLTWQRPWRQLAPKKPY